LKRVLCTFAWAMSMALSASRAADTAPGKELFDHYCAECHGAGPGHPGTQQLGWLHGESRALLEKRTDLSPDYVKFVVRHGLWEMPPFRPTEMDDAALARLAEYLARPGKH
jgi:mono/diheme cytochrome c family protein